jgi:hypothetical protein
MSAHCTLREGLRRTFYGYLRLLRRTKYAAIRPQAEGPQEAVGQGQCGGIAAHLAAGVDTVCAANLATGMHRIRYEKP